MTPASALDHETAADDAWRAALEHAAGCPECRTPGGCETGQGLLDAYGDACRAERDGRHADA